MSNKRHSNKKEAQSAGSTSAQDTAQALAEAMAHEAQKADQAQKDAIAQAVLPSAELQGTAYGLSLGYRLAVENASAERIASEFKQLYYRRGKTEKDDAWIIARARIYMRIGRKRLQVERHAQAVAEAESKTKAG